ncbi:HNH endonuclease [Rossellomorea marisflavi]|uniref:HNH endonuclease n=1 Tax=Rossellomorea marisflavi TaxID=189381 RepID=UPI0039BF7C07
MKEFLEVNDLNYHDLEEVLEQCFLSSLFEEVVRYIEKNGLYNSFKLRLQNSFNQKEELFVLKDLIGEFSEITLLDYQASKILLFLKAYYNKSNTRTPLLAEDKISILNNQNETCIFCTSKISINNAHFDHIIAFKWVGDSLENNFQALCQTCNLEKNTNPYYYLKSYLSKQNRTKYNTTST